MMRFKNIALTLIVAFICFLACHDKLSNNLIIPSHFTPIPTLADNPISSEKIALGHRLFHDPNLSLDSTISCASCHKKEFAFADNKPISPGIHGRLTKRNTPSIFNVAYIKNINKDGGVQKLDIQALVPLEDENEMGISILELSRRLQNDPSYSILFNKAYNRIPDPYTIPRALASYVRTLLSGHSKYDQFLKGDINALSDKEKQGLALFNSEKLQCATCHAGIHLANEAFENNGLYEMYKDLGRGGITLNKADYGKFRIPSLRNVALTAPYMHDGSIATIEQVIEHYASGGASNEYKSPLITGFTLTTQEKDQLIAFLFALTEE